ncbi:ABC transporter ATP-binding protein [Falsiroseomonas oryzae]|uniref:ABC transporter ATP-binding protein n=1 Tax=Falsiroseomonas oryzae TaxID=2766473 RepID=UPI0022EACC62|nr:ABC transporter ATP-binding protein [Roseomonas sp. MO-31]
MADALLSVDALVAGWGEGMVLEGVSLAVAPGEAVALLGRNGAGKTTLICTLMGVARQRGGSIRLGGTVLDRLPPERRAVLGLGWVPQERNVFRSLTVEENLSAVARPGRWTVPAVYELFPRLAERRGNLGSQLSGGEQQMLAIGRALMLNPRLLLLDEPLEGLAPVIVQMLLAAIRRLVREEGMAAIVVEQHAGQILPVADRAVILERGRVAAEGAARDMLADPALLDRHLGVTSH